MSTVSTPESQPFMYVVTYNPSDFPGLYVARRYDSPEFKATENYFTSNSINELKEKVFEIHPSIISMPPSKEDDPVIIEIWIV